MKTIILFLLTTASYCTLFAETKISTNNENELPEPLLTDEWNVVNYLPNGGLYSMIMHGNDIYIGGAFEDLANIPAADYMARWDGCDWHAVSPAIDGVIYSMESSGNALYAVGSFTGYVGKWVNNTWTALPGLPSEPFDIAINANGIYVAAYDQGGGPIVNVYKLNGSTWTPLGAPVELIDYAGFKLGTSSNTLYIGGYFEDAGGDANADYIAKWNGSNWEGLGAGLDGMVNHIVASGNDIYACGSFNDAGGNPDADKIARWDGSNWNNVGTGFNYWDYLTAMLVTSDYIYVYVTDWSDCYDYFRRYSFQTSSWDYYPEYSVWGCGESFSILEFDSDIYAATSWDIERWGEPGPYIEITGVPGILCQDAAPITLPTPQNGYTGTWSGPGVTNNVFNPAGQYGYTELTFTPTPGQCVPTANWEIDVYLQQLEYDFSPTICESSPPVPLLQYQFGVSGTWSGAGVSNNFFDPEGLFGSYPLTFTPFTGQCYAVATLWVQVELTVTPNISGVPQTICENGSSIALPVIQSGIEGNWSGQGVTNNTFDPSGLNGSITLTFTPDPEFCATENTFGITVNPQITITISGLPATLCQLSPPISLPTTQSGVPGNWSGPGVVNNSFNPVNQNGNVTLTFSPLPTQCAVPVSATINVFINVPVITGVPTSVCESNPPIALPTSLNGIDGNWTGQGVSNNIFYPAGLSGNVPLIFHPASGECANPATQIVHVDPLITPVLTDIPFSMCSLDDPINLPEDQGGFTGSWSGLGVYNNMFDPEDLNGDILLTFTPTSGECVDTAGAIITVQAANPPVITGIPSSVCVLAAPVVLPTAQQGISGNWSGQGVVNNMFNPSGLNGAIPLLFSPLFGQCAVSSSTAITVYTSFTPAITGVPAVVCENAAPQNLITLQSGVTGNWSGPGVVNNIFNPTGQNESATLLFTPLPMQCATSTSWTITIDTVEVPGILDFPTAVCESDLPIALDTVQSGIAGTWTGSGIVNDTFNPAGLMGMVQVTFNPNPDQCALPASTDILVNVHVHPVLLDLPDSICQVADPLPLSPVQNGIEGSWYGQSIVNDTFSPREQVGLVTLFFVPKNGPCEDTATTQLFVNAAPTATNLHVTCDSVGNTYVVSFDITGGDPASYMVDDSLLGATSFTSAPISYTQTHFEFALNDAVGCEPRLIIGINTCLCATNAGTMQINDRPLRVCKGPKFIVNHQGDQQLDPDDVLGFILHDQSGNQLGQVFTLNNVPVFSYVPGMVLGQTYFISAVAGTNNGQGAVNLSDPCLSVSPGVPVIFYNCDPKEDDKDADLVDHNGRPGPVPFDDGTEKSLQESEVQGNTSNEKTKIIIDDSDVVIKTYKVYDLLGRVLYTLKNIPFAEYKSSPESFQRNLIPGYYLEVFEVENGDGEVAYINRRITVMGQ